MAAIFLNLRLIMRKLLSTSVFGAKFRQSSQLIARNCFERDLGQSSAGLPHNFPTPEAAHAHSTWKLQIMV